MNTTLLVLAKAPVAGRVKTRLCPPCSPHEAAALAEAALRDTVGVVDAAPAARRALVLEGQPPRWLPPDWEVRAQQGDGLAERLAHAFGQTTGPTLLVGMDTPHITVARLDHAARALDHHDALIGFADDGGYWIIGMREPDPAVFSNVPMSTTETGAQQFTRLTARFSDVATTETLNDFDTWSDALAIAAVAPTTRFAATLRAIERQKSASTQNPCSPGR